MDAVAAFRHGRARDFTVILLAPSLCEIGRLLCTLARLIMEAEIGGSLASWLGSRRGNSRFGTTGAIKSFDPATATHYCAEMLQPILGSQCNPSSDQHCRRSLRSSIGIRYYLFDLHYSVARKYNENSGLATDDEKSSQASILVGDDCLRRLPSSARSETKIIRWRAVGRYALAVATIFKYQRLTENSRRTRSTIASI
jgi:hypothetical protein